MNKQGFTPGPWVVSSSVMVCTKDARLVANCIALNALPELSVPMSEARANAKLIAAAPAMLEALKECAIALRTASHNASKEGFETKMKSTGETLKIRPLSEVLTSVYQRVDAVIAAATLKEGE